MDANIAFDIVIPVYNEPDVIADTLLDIAKHVQHPIRVLVVYDYEQDTTLPVLLQMKSSLSYETILVKNKFGRGALNAIKTGMLASSANHVLVVMADRSDDIEKIDSMYDKSQEGYDIVCGSRYMKGGKQIGGPKLKKFLSRTAGISLHYLARIPTHDVTNSFKMYKRTLFDELHIESVGGFEIGMEITVKAFLNRKRITEVPVTWTDRSAGESKFKLWKWIPHYLKWYMHAFNRTEEPTSKEMESRNV